jgi:hypothetical protein
MNRINRSITASLVNLRNFTKNDAPVPDAYRALGHFALMAFEIVFCPPRPDQTSSIREREHSTASLNSIPVMIQVAVA